MNKIAIISDTDTSFSETFALENKISMVPIMIQFGDETLKDTYGINNSDIFLRINKEGKLPTTSAPSPGQFKESFQQAFNSGANSIICFTVSGEVSATYSAAMNARNEMPDKDISVIDTKSLTMQQGYMVLAAAEKASAGASADEIIQSAYDIRDRSCMYAALDTLKYLAMSGRVGHLAAGFANLLDVKPILTIRNGKLDLLEKSRTQKKSWNRTIELLNNSFSGRKIEKICILHVNVPDKAHMFRELVKDNMECPEKIDIVELNPGLSIHSGTGLVGAVAVFSK